MVDRRTLAKRLSELESGASAPSDVESGPAQVVGVTGPPGAGKSTLLNVMISELRSREMTVSVLAVDPSSPVTGGALLGDRIRMQGHVDDPGVYIRSMASRGHLGGLAEAAGPVIAALSGAGFDLVIVETVGVGQSEVEVMDHVQQVVLVVAPGWGDGIQADKAGVLEVADIVVVNKADRQGADDVLRALHGSVGEGVDVLSTTATTGEGVAPLVDRILAG